MVVVNSEPGQVFSQLPVLEVEDSVTAVGHGIQLERSVRPSWCHQSPPRAGGRYLSETVVGTKRPRTYRDKTFLEVGFVR